MRYDVTLCSKTLEGNPKSADSALLQNTLLSMGWSLLFSTEYTFHGRRLVAKIGVTHCMGIL